MRIARFLTVTAVAVLRSMAAPVYLPYQARCRQSPMPQRRGRT